jgi:hypothetical protein
MPSSDKINLGSSPKHHYVRTIFSSLFGFFALALIIVSILVVWLDGTISSTSQYTKTVAPLVADPDVQAFVVEKASGALLESKDAPIGDIALGLLGEAQVAGKTDEQLRTEVTPIVKENLKKVIASPAFAELWKANNSAIHAELIKQLKSSSPTIELDFRPLIEGVINELSTTDLAFIKDGIELKDDAGKITLKEKQLDNVRKVYDYFQKAMLAIVGLAVLASALCVIISVHHLKTMRRIALMTGIFAGILAAVLGAASLFKIGGDDLVQQKFAVALINGVTHDLRLSLIVIAVLGIGVAIGSKIYSVVSSKKQPAPKKPGSK